MKKNQSITKESHFTPSGCMRIANVGTKTILSLDPAGGAHFSVVLEPKDWRDMFRQMLEYTWAFSDLYPDEGSDTEDFRRVKDRL